MYSGHPSITPVVLLGTTQLYNASLSSSSVNVHVLVSEPVHVMFILYKNIVSALGEPTFTGDITNLVSYSDTIGGTDTNLWMKEFDVVGDFTITAVSNFNNRAILEVTSLEAD